jgi:hypothetical protein
MFLFSLNSHSKQAGEEYHLLRAVSFFLHHGPALSGASSSFHILASVATRSREKAFGCLSISCSAEQKFQRASLNTVEFTASLPFSQHSLPPIMGERF